MNQFGRIWIPIPSGIQTEVTARHHVTTMIVLEFIFSSICAWRISPCICTYGIRCTRCFVHVHCTIVNLKKNYKNNYNQIHEIQFHGFFYLYGMLSKCVQLTYGEVEKATNSN